MELARVEEEIEKLLNTLTGSNAVPVSYTHLDVYKRQEYLHCIRPA